jgi:hypothetical protein
MEAEGLRLHVDTAITFFAVITARDLSALLGFVAAPRVTGVDDLR